MMHGKFSLGFAIAGRTNASVATQARHHIGLDFPVYNLATK
jgi:hypothetical protein